MAVTEETLIDAPVTPAPIFAYRALRAVFWGEDETPEKPSRTVDLDLLNAAENVQTVHGNGARSTLQLTPSQKRKRAALIQTSPTKSILRTPGVNTPRRALLKDLNVSFKDIRKSISPELAQKESLLQSNDRIALNNEKENQPMRSATAMPPTKPTTHATKSPTLQTSKPARSVPSPSKPKSHKVVGSVDCQHPSRTTTITTTAATSTTHATTFDAEMYMRNTEKEMKKLIKYGQKMRDYAHRQDEENEKLRGMLEELRNENKRLKEKLDESESKKERPEKVVAPLKENGSLKSCSITRNAPLNEPVAKVAQPATKNTLAKSDLLSPNNGESYNQSSKASIVRTKRRFEEPLNDVNGPASAHSTRVSSPPKRARNRPIDNETDVTRSTQKEQQDLPLHPITNGTSTMRLAPDRLAAARARVRKKAELRKASTEAESERVDGNSKVETSLVEWAGL